MDAPHSPEKPISLDDIELTPQPLIKWLGVLIDPKLTFSTHVKTQAAKGLKTAHRLSSLARTGWGIPLNLCLRLTSSLIYSRTDYACVVWHKYGGSPTRVAAIQRSDNVGHRFALGAFKTHPVDYLLHDTNSCSAGSRLDMKITAAVARLLTLPTDNPVAQLTTLVLSKNRTRHQSSLHHAIHHPTSLWHNLPSQVEVLDPTTKQLTPHPRSAASIAETRDESLEFVELNLADRPPNTFVVYCDGASQKAGTGAAATDDTGNQLQLRLGSNEFYTAYDGELISLLLALGLVRKAPSTTNFFWVLNDSQTAIRDITTPPPLKSGLHIRLLIHKEIRRLLHHRPLATLAFIWCAKAGEVEGQVKADALAKQAAGLPLTSELPVSHAALSQLIRKQFRERPTPPTLEPAKLRRLLNSYNPEKSAAALKKLTRPDATMVVQLRAGHCPLNAFLHRIGATDDPNCSLCLQPETVEHFLLTCKKFIGLRQRLFRAATKLKIPRKRQDMLADPRLYQDLADYGRKSFRFYKSRYPRNRHTPTTRPGTHPTTQHHQIKYRPP